jgi:hypothetical protein
MKINITDITDITMNRKDVIISWWIAMEWSKPFVSIVVLKTF